MTKKGYSYNGLLHTTVSYGFSPSPIGPWQVFTWPGYRGLEPITGYSNLYSHNFPVTLNFLDQKTIPTTRDARLPVRKYMAADTVD